MISPTESDVGRDVLYAPRPGCHEVGTITSFNDAFVFVRYRGDAHSKATPRGALEWAHVAFDPLDRLDTKVAPPLSRCTGRDAL